MENQNKKFNYLLSISFLISGLLIAGALIYSAGLKSFGPLKRTTEQNKSQVANLSDLEEKVIPSAGVELPIKWGNLGEQLIEAGVIDSKKFEALYTQRGGLTEEEKKLIYAEDNGNLIISPGNAGFILNLFWALGLGNKNEILEKGPMADPQYGGAQNFASTGDWTLAEGSTMNHYSYHPFIILTSEQQQIVERVSKGIYRPCCDNSTYFPDCNHGMAMLGLLGLMASQGINEDEMYRIALLVNSYWFPDTYLTIGKYFQNRGIDWDKIDAKETLGYNFSSGSGYQNILAQVEPLKIKGGGSCGV